MQMIYVAAIPDAQTTDLILQLRAWLSAQGFPLVQDLLPPHLLLCGYPASAAQDVLHIAAAAAERARSFTFTYSHVGIAPGSSAYGTTLILAPEVNRPLLALRERFVHSQGWPLHTPLLTLPTQQLPQILPWVLPNINPFDARITALAVFHQNGTELFRREL